VDPIEIAEIKEAYKVDPWFCDHNNTETLSQVNGLYWKGLQLAAPNNEGIKDKIILFLPRLTLCRSFGQDQDL
jgi:hypothetical protein